MSGKRGEEARRGEERRGGGLVLSELEEPKIPKWRVIKVCHTVSAWVRWYDLTKAKWCLLLSKFIIRAVKLVFLYNTTELTQPQWNSFCWFSHLWLEFVHFKFACLSQVKENQNLQGWRYPALAARAQEAVGHSLYSLHLLESPQCDV